MGVWRRQTGSNARFRKIQEALTYTGFNRLVFSSDFKSLAKTDDRIRLNLSAIAKGYGVDMVARLLEEEGYRDYIVEIGGEVRAAGRKNSAGEPWNIGIAKPSPREIPTLLLWN
ncbi:MAG: FAD:protein FMN transferase [Alphaproteobacteria bacterium]